MARFKKVSADEARSSRANVTKEVGGQGVVFKGATFKAPSSWNPEKRTARFTMTSESVDRYGDVVVQAGLDLTRFLENPQGLLFHNSRSWPAGVWSDIVKNLTGRPKRTEGTFNFLPEGTDEDADRAARHVAAGSIRTVSIGFAPDWDQIELILDDEEDWVTGLKFNASELLECSLVPIPAQPDALAKDAGGDWKIAKEVIEEILDGWARSPEGLLIPKGVHERTYRTIVEKIGEDEIAPAARANPSEEEIAAFVAIVVKAGAKIEEHESMMTAFKDGQSLASLKIDSLLLPVGVDVHKDVHERVAAAKWKMPNNASGLLSAEQDAELHRIAKENGHDAADAAVAAMIAEKAKGSQLLTDEVLDAFAAQVKDGDVVVLRDGTDMELVIEREGERVEALKLPLEMTIQQINETSQSICDRVSKTKEPNKTVSVASVSIDVDTKDATEKVGAFEAMLDRVTGKLAKIFGRNADAEPPVPPAPPSDEAVAAAKAASSAARARIQERGLIGP